MITMERQARSNLIKLPFADDESIVSSTIREDPADTYIVSCLHFAARHNKFIDNDINLPNFTTRV